MHAILWASAFTRPGRLPPAPGASAGERVSVVAACRSLADARTAAALVAEGGIEAEADYVAFMLDPETLCGDARVNGGRALFGVLVAWEGSVTGTARRVEIWRILGVSMRGVYYTWRAPRRSAPAPMPGEGV